MLEVGLWVGQRAGSGAEVPQLAPGRGRVPTRTEQLSVLIVDDIADTRHLYQHYFEWQGLRVISAADGIAGLQAVLWESPDVIVLDLAMPRMTGWEVLESLKADARTRGIPVIVLSGQGQREQAIVKGADSYCSKPCLPDALLHEVQRVVRESSRKL
jgi:CheY-like chemotaxis protein